MESKQVQSINKWLIYPDALQSKTFGGFNSRDDITEMRGYFPIGQNIIFTDGGKPTLRQGTELIGTLIEAVTPIMRAWRFERQDGVQIEMRTYDTKVEYWIDGISTNWALLKDGFTTGLKFTFCVISKSSNVTSLVYFCNGVEDWYKWSGVYETVASFDDGAHTLTLSGTTTLADLGFTATGTVIVNGTEIIYTSIANQTFSGCSSMLGVTSIIDSYSEINQNSTNTLSVGFFEAGQTFNVADDTILSKATFYIKKSSTPTGNAYAKIYAITGSSGTDAVPTGAALATSDAVNVSGLTTSYALTDFTFSGANKITLSAGIQYAVSIYYDGAAGLKQLIVGDSTTITHSGNAYTMTDAGVYSAINKDLCFYVYGNTIIPVTSDIVMQSPVAASLTSFKSSVAFVDNGRIHARLETKQAVSNYSKLDDPDNWTAGASDGDGGAKFIEQGGSIVAYAHDESKLFIFKKRLIKTLEFKQAGDKVDIPVYATYKPSDDKSTTVGALGDKSTFHAPNGILFVTEDKELLYLKRQEYIDYPQQISISDIIRPTFQQGIHDNASGIVWKSKVYYAFKQDTNSAANDVVVIYDLIRNRWFMPIVGWNVNDWTIINNELHWHSSISPNSYKLIDSNRTDLGLNFTTILRTHAETFDMYKSPQEQAVISDLMFEIYMTENAVINFDIFYDEDGYTEIDSAVLRGTDQANLVNSTTYNPFGANPFGYEQFGSNATVSGMKKYRYLIPLKGNNEVYNMSVSWSTQDAGVNYELIRYGYFVKEVIKRPNNKIIFNIAK